MVYRSEEPNSVGTEPATGAPSVDRSAVRRLPLEPRVEVGPDKCIVRVSLRREEVTVHKETFVADVATVRRVSMDDVERVGDTVRAERLRVDVDGDVTVIRENDVARAPEDREQAR